MSSAAVPFPEASLGKRLWVYTAFLRNAFLNMLAYRLRYYTGIVTYFMFVSVHFFIWQAIFSGEVEMSIKENRELGVVEVD